MIIVSDEVYFKIKEEIEAAQDQGSIPMVAWFENRFYEMMTENKRLAAFVGNYSSEALKDPTGAAVAIRNVGVIVYEILKREMKHRGMIE